MRVIKSILFALIGFVIAGVLGIMIDSRITNHSFYCFWSCGQKATTLDFVIVIIFALFGGLIGLRWGMENPK